MEWIAELKAPRVYASSEATQITSPNPVTFFISKSFARSTVLRDNDLIFHMQQQTAPDPTVVPENPAANVPSTDPVEALTKAIDLKATLSTYVKDWIQQLNLPAWSEDIAINGLLFLLLGLSAILIFFFVRPFVLRTFTKIIQHSNTKWDDFLIEFGIAKWISHLIAAWAIQALIPELFSHAPDTSDLLSMLMKIYMVVAGFMVINSLLDGIRTVFDRTKAAAKLPSTSLVQVMKLLATVVAIILIVSTLSGKSPLAFLGGLGVFTSVIMLVFKDAILGLAAGIQLASNDMIKKDDWIDMPKHGADGTVEEVGLTTVKVVNFDKSVTTIPTYTLISESFKNWRPMQKSGGRRIKRSIFIDLSSIRLCNEEMLARYRKIQYISNYLTTRLEDIKEWNARLGLDPSTHIVNGRQLTNLGTFRAYIEAYLRNHPQVHSGTMTLIVRQLASGPTGLPIEIYCFCKQVGWSDYEMVQSDIFDHIFAVVREFDLELFQNPTKIGI
jgi:miniconductance mechanosensitive channel